MAFWSFSAVDAGEPEERAADEKELEEKEGERKAEKTGSEAKESKGDVVVVVLAEWGELKVERRWIGEAATAAETVAEEEERGDLWDWNGDGGAAAGDAISVGRIFSRQTELDFLVFFEFIK